MNAARQYSDRPFSSDLIHVLWEAFFIFLVGAFFGVLIHHQLLWKVVTGQTLVQVAHPSEERHPGEIFLIPVAMDEVREMVARGAVLVDARAEEAYREGHIAGAISLPLAMAVEELIPFTKRVPAATPIIVYCSGYGCRDSHELGARLIEAGYGEVLVYEGGFPEWRDQGLPTGRGNQP
ncbi:MAG: rhodanese-like domain-containing protein [Desulfuromonadaceae bacterium]|nr:rhodanese-like domain-containing protein [Desulfuromonadaceae bacterium]